MRPVLIVHGGAWYLPRRKREAAREGVRRAAAAGRAVLERGGSALDAVEAAVRVMEDDPTFDAGRGSYLNLEGEVEMDAIIMDGRTLDLGAVAAIRRVRHPVTVARLVMERSPHNFFVGAGATAFAARVGIPLCDPAELLGRTGDEHPEDERWSPPEWEAERAAFAVDTVGAVALDAAGHLAVATSTGGMPHKAPGRVGDSPLVGSGAYADDRLGAASATGWGERLMRVVISKTACDFLARGMTAQGAAEAAIALLHERVRGYGGLIVIDREGRIGAAHNTPHMAHAWMHPAGEIVAKVE